MGQKKILIVEDDGFIREIYVTKFLHEGFLVISAENGIQALEKIAGELPDLILLDIVMPYMDGIETLKRIRQTEGLANIPVIMLSNISEREKVDESLVLGISGYLVKSNFLPQEIVNKVNAILGI